MQSRRKRLLVVIASVIGIVAAIVFVFCHHARKPVASEVLGDDIDDMATPVPIPPQLVAAQDEPSAREVEPAPVIDKVNVEKSEVCAGEENLISIKAHTTNGTDGFLHYAVGEFVGQEIPFRIWPEPDGTIEMPRVNVFARGNIVTTTALPYFRVRDCGPQPFASITARVLPNRPSTYEFMAQVLFPRADAKEGAHSASDARSYKWSFGDGVSEVTATPRTTHEFKIAGDDKIYTQRLITVEATMVDGKTIKARLALQLVDLAASNLAEVGVVTLFAEPTPLFPVLSDDGLVKQTFRIYHRHRADVRLKKVTLRRHYNTALTVSPPEELAPERVVGSDVVPARHSLEVPLILDTTADPDVFQITYVLEGESSDGYAARGTITLMRPPPKPTRETSVAIKDETLLKKVRLARTLLNKEFVTDEDIWRLEREGTLRME